MTARAQKLIACASLAVAVGGALAACGTKQEASTGGATSTQASVTTAPATTSQSGAVPSSSAAGVAPAPNGPARCNATVLTGKVEPAGAGAGQRDAKLVVTNTGSAPCTLSGYSGLQLHGAGGKQVPTDLQRQADPGPTPLQLAPGSSAAADLHWTVVPTGNEPVDTPCEAEATQASAIPPNETQPINLTWNFGPVCGAGHIRISAFYAA
ncbi:MAG TPA: DUF4232 domain-containing protein [Pseudonocardiaceae bacterium]|jgi:type IV secretory pathway TrbL component|nr:DUF4232 domain-containing protein [Pseudonocardiaceae bacterium]